MNEQIYAYAAFPYDADASDKYMTRSESADAIIRQNGVTKPDGATPDSAWTPAMFRPESGLHRFNVFDTDGGTLSDEPDENAESFGLPANIREGFYLTLYGDKDDVIGFCQALADAIGTDCYLKYNVGDIFEDEVWPPINPLHLTPKDGPVSNLLDLLYNEPENY